MAGHLSWPRGSGRVLVERIPSSVAVRISGRLLFNSGLFQPAVRALRDAHIAFSMFIRRLACRPIAELGAEAVATPFGFDRRGGRSFTSDTDEDHPGRPAFFGRRHPDGRQPLDGGEHPRRFDGRARSFLFFAEVVPEQRPDGREDVSCGRR